MVNKLERCKIEPVKTKGEEHSDMSTDHTVHIWRLPKTSDLTELQTQAKATREVRLRSLKLDSEKFYSKYEDEVKQPLDFFVDRLKPAWVEHFVAAVVGDQAMFDEQHAPRADEYNKFEAILVMINEHAKGEEGATLRQSGFNVAEGYLPTYSLAAVWVAPEYRGQRLGSEMIAKSLGWLKEDAIKRGWRRARCQLGAKPTNGDAIRLYRRFDFEVCNNHNSELEFADEVNMVLLIELQDA